MTTRPMSDGAEEEFAGDSIEPVYLAALDFEEGIVRLWQGVGEIQALGFTWTGCGVMGQVGEIEETAEGRAVGVVLKLAGVGNPIPVGDDTVDVLAVANSSNWQQRTARIYYGLLAAGRTWAVEPFQVAKKMMDTMDLADGKDGGILLRLESAFFDNERAEVLRYTAETQRALYPGDAGCDQVAALQEREIKWTLG